MHAIENVHAICLTASQNWTACEAATIFCSCLWGSYTYLPLRQLHFVAAKSGHGPKVACDTGRPGLGSVPPKWGSARASARCDRARAGPGSGFSRAEPEPPSFFATAMRNQNIISECSFTKSLLLGTAKVDVKASSRTVDSMTYWVQSVEKPS